jgi:hypothetical protein
MVNRKQATIWPQTEHSVGSNELIQYPSNKSRQMLRVVLQGAWSAQYIPWDSQNQKLPDKYSETSDTNNQLL